jgi:hypothetical protein
VDDPCPAEIINNPKFWLFLKDAVGTLNGTHISTFPLYKGTFECPSQIDNKLQN